MGNEESEFIRVIGSSDDKMIAEWYESHEVTDHVESTTEVDRENIVYQDSSGNWYRSADGIQVFPPEQESVIVYGDYVKTEARLINEVPLKQPISVYTAPERMKAQLPSVIEKEGENTWTSTSLSSVTMQKQQGKSMHSV